MSNWFPPPSRPRDVDGGLRARSRRGAIAQNWWSARFIEVLESMGMGNRLTRGRNYARRGQVIEMHVDAGSVTASVQGSRSRPYRVRIGVAAYGKADWGRVSQALADDAWYAAKLLAGEMPTDIEDLFAGEGLALFPERARDLTMDCTCPDSQVPCKHLAAVFYLLAEAFDEDPFTILALRGRERADLLEAVSALRGGTVAADRPEGGDGAVPLTDCLEDFWGMSAPLPAPAGQGFDGAPADAVLDQVPPVEVTIRGVALVDALRVAYGAEQSASQE